MFISNIQATQNLYVFWGLPNLVYKSTVWNWSHMFSIQHNLTKHDQILGHLVQAALTALNLGYLRAKDASS